MTEGFPLQMSSPRYLEMKFIRQWNQSILSLLLAFFLYPTKALAVLRNFYFLFCTRFVQKW